MAVTDSIQKDISKGRKAGPFPSPPFNTFRGSPLGAFPKKRSSSKIRVINDLSWPPGKSINDGIDTDDCKVQYMRIDDVVQYIRTLGKGTLLAKLDLEDAFNHVLVRPEDWDLLGLTWDNVLTNGDVHTDYYVSMVLPFGLRSAPKLFSEFALATKLIMYRNGVTYADNYLDDYITAGPADTNVCAHNLAVMLNTCSDVGFAVNPAKVVQPSTEMEFLGIIIDTDKLELRISQERLNNIIQELDEWQGKKKAKKRDLLSLIGKLSFISKVVRSGRTFIRRLIDLSKRVKHLHYKVKLNKAAQGDIQWWVDYLPTWNGKGMFHDQDWVQSNDMELFTDASNIGLGGYFQGEWFVIPVSERLQKDTHICYREMLALLVAATVWGRHWAGKNVLFHCDNMGVVGAVESGTSKCPQLMNLIRKLFFIAARHQFDFKTVYVSTTDNNLADALSRMDMPRFHKAAPEACPHPVFVNMEELNGLF
jgi:hypothetical protein